MQYMIPGKEKKSTMKDIIGTTDENKILTNQNMDCRLKFCISVKVHEFNS